MHPQPSALTTVRALVRSSIRTVARHLWREWLRPLALPILFVTAAKSALADINYVPTGSMQPTILCGDVVFINKLAYDLRVPFTTTRLARWAEPDRGDIVVCFAPDTNTRLVKRIAALPGDTVELRDDHLNINGTRQPSTPLPSSAPGVRDLPPAERAASHFAREALAAHASSPPRVHSMQFLPALRGARTFGPVTVPPGHYFVLGDNRDNSRDSRSFGFMPRAEIIGEVTAVAASVDPARRLRPRFDRFFSKLD